MAWTKNVQVGRKGADERLCSLSMTMMLQVLLTGVCENVSA